MEHPRLEPSDSRRGMLVAKSHGATLSAAPEWMVAVMWVFPPVSSTWLMSESSWERKNCKSLLSLSMCPHEPCKKTTMFMFFLRDPFDTTRRRQQARWVAVATPRWPKSRSHSECPLIFAKILKQLCVRLGGRAGTDREGDARHNEVA